MARLKQPYGMLRVYRHSPKRQAGQQRDGAIETASSNKSSPGPPQGGQAGQQRDGAIETPRIIRLPPVMECPVGHSISQAGQQRDGAIETKSR